ncbi:hypothetical protein E2C01_074311 [Portunus trituberculatus]|uniref:Uncharacterized protein n=1 Tax=Portunus trituberculatus TaxID=210409 RepID=A0A5B7IC25_PORTR|nr:hypothetical protein [Portunus trituberculatus]
MVAVIKICVLKVKVSVGAVPRKTPLSPGHRLGDWKVRRGKDRKAGRGRTTGGPAAHSAEAVPRMAGRQGTGSPETVGGSSGVAGSQLCHQRGGRRRGVWASLLHVLLLLLLLVAASFRQD